MRIFSGPIKNLIIISIKLYKLFISPLFPDVCRHYPSCSSYALEALKKYGLLEGGVLAVKRLFKCNPFYPGGYDPLK